MRHSFLIVALCCFWAESALLLAAEQADVAKLLNHGILEPGHTRKEAYSFCDSRIPPMPKVSSADEWTAVANRIRQDILEKVIFVGEAAKWRDAKTRVVWCETIAGGPGYHIKKLRYEALPGLWIPAVLYVPDKLSGKAPAMLNVNGHDRAHGKALDYKQIRCINLAKRGIITLSPEWLHMGQLYTPGLNHFRMCQLDLCGTSGVGVFYLAVSRGLDLLLSLEHVDPNRVGASGLSGGAWQTIILGALDPRVALINPVAGYGPYYNRIHVANDLGDAEQVPTDLALYADYTHLTAMRAPRPALVTYNAKDMWFNASHTIPLLKDAALPIFKLFGAADACRFHVNKDPGDHNYLVDNREALYRLIGDYFYPGDKGFDRRDIPSEDELKSIAELVVEMPRENEDFNTLALTLCTDLPKQADLPTDPAKAAQWQAERRAKLREIARFRTYGVEKATKTGSEEHSALRAAFWKLSLGQDWTVPAVELARGTPKKVAILVADGGRAAMADSAARLLDSDYAVLAVDPFYLGECAIPIAPFPYALLISSMGERAIGLQAGQIAAVARWAKAKYEGAPVLLLAKGIRCTPSALVAVALEEKAIDLVELHDCLGTLKEVIERSWAPQDYPDTTDRSELFCFGLLEAFDIKQIAALVAPRPVTFASPSDRVKGEMRDLEGFYRLLGQAWNPLQ